MFGRYLGVSVLALSVDVTVLAACVGATGLPAGASAGVGYGAGALAHYALSRRYVFASGWLDGLRWVEFMAFVASGLCGLAATVGVVRFLSDEIALSLPFAKAAAVAVSFVLVYLLRKSLVFRPVGHDGNSVVR